MKKIIAIAVAVMATNLFAGDWIPVASRHPGEPTNIHIMHGGTTVQVARPRVHRPHHHHSGGLVGTVLGAIFGDCHHYDYPQTVVVEQPVVATVPAAQTVVVQQPVQTVVTAPAPATTIVTPTYQKRVIEGHYVDNYVNGQVVKTWVPAREEWVRVQ